MSIEEQFCQLIIEGIRNLMESSDKRHLHKRLEMTKAFRFKGDEIIHGFQYSFTLPKEKNKHMADLYDAEVSLIECKEYLSKYLLSDGQFIIIPFLDPQYIETLLLFLHKQKTSSESLQKMLIVLNLSIKDYNQKFNIK